jgi:glycosyltransferase involved in cell wall biosynthesis
MVDRAVQTITNGSGENVNTANKLISVIIPVYNAEKTIRRCIDSLLSQTYRIFEVILVDDGSSDRSGEICDEAAGQIQVAGTNAFLSQNRFDHSDADVTEIGAVAAQERGALDIRIRVVHTPNGGVSRARNTGIKLADGQYITFVDADDTVSPDYLTRLIEAAKDPDVIMVSMTDAMQEEQPVSGYRYLEYGLFRADSHVWGKLYRQEDVTKMLGDNWFPDGLTIGEDMLMLLGIALKTGAEHGIRVIGTGSYNYAMNEEGAMLTQFRPSYMDQIRCWDMAEDMLRPYQGKISDYIYTRLAVIQIMAAFLVAGKMAVSGIISDEHLDLVRKAVKHGLKRNGAFAGLETGYKIKTILFGLSPHLYFRLYGRWKK